MWRKVCFSLVTIVYLAFGLEDLPTGFFNDIDGISVSLSTTHLCSLESKPGVEMGGTVACWGFDYNDILFVPRKEIFVQVVISRDFGCGITLDQRVKCWGKSAREVSGLYSQITASEIFMCGVLVDGRINCWGMYKFPLPQPGASKFVQISCGATQCCTLDSQGVAACWGWRTVGKKLTADPPLAELFTDADGIQHLRTLRDTSSSQVAYDLDEEEEGHASQATESSLSPIQFKQISVGKSFSCGIQHLDGKIRCWGNLKGILRGTDLIDSQAPYRQVSVGQHGVCMIAEGTNAASCLGISSLPSSVEWDQLKVGKEHVCGVTMDSELRCSGPRHTITNSLRDDFVVA